MQFDLFGETDRQAGRRADKTFGKVKNKKKYYNTQPTGPIGCRHYNYAAATYRGKHRASCCGIWPATSAAVARFVDPPIRRAH